MSDYRSQKISPVEFFATPKSWNDLYTWINNHPGPERALAMTAAMMAWNLACKITQLPDDEAILEPPDASKGNDGLLGIG